MFNGIDTLYIGTSGTAGNFKSWFHNNNPGAWFYQINTPIIRLNFEPTLVENDDYSFQEDCSELFFSEYV